MFALLVAAEACSADVRFRDTFHRPIERFRPNTVTFRDFLALDWIELGEVT